MTDPVVPSYINPLPPAPEVTDSVPEFDSKAFPFVEALVDLTGEINATVAGTYQNALAAGEGAVTSTTSAGVATTAKNDAVIAKNAAQAAQVAAEAARDDALTNTKGWSPMLRLENDGDRRVLFVYDWTGGAGTKPSVTGYIGASGLTPNKSLAIDVRGKQGLPGTGGDLMQILGGFDASNQTPITDTDTLIGAIGKAQGQINKANLDLAASSGAAMVGFKQQGEGAVARTAQDKMRERVSVKDFGAIGDGTLHTVAEWISPGALAKYSSLAQLQVDYPHVTNTTDSIDWASTQAAINAATKGALGFSVYMPAGTYLLNRKIVIPTQPSSSASRTRLLGDGWGTVISPAVAMDGLLLVEGSGVKVSQIQFLDTGALCSRGVEFKPPSSTLNLEFELSGCRIQGFQYGFYADGPADNWRVVDNYFLANTIANVYSADYGLNSLISGNYIYSFGAGGDGIVVRKNIQQPEGMRIVNNITLTPGGRGLDMDTGLAMYIGKNIFDQQKYGSLVGSETNPIGDIDLEANWFGPKAGAEREPQLRIFKNATDVRCRGCSFVGEIALHIDNVQNVSLLANRFKCNGSGADDTALLVTNSKAVQAIGNFWQSVSGSAQNVIEEDHTSTVTYIGNRFTLKPSQRSNASTYFLNYGDDTSVISGQPKPQLAGLSLGMPATVTPGGTLPFVANVGAAIARFGTFPPQFDLCRSRSSTVGTHELVQSGDVLGRVAFSGSDGSAFAIGARVAAAADGIPATGSMPTRLSIETTPPGSTTPVERVRADSLGNVLIAYKPAGVLPADTDGFAYLPTTNGSPTGVPTVYNGAAPMVVDKLGSKLWVNINGTWKSCALV